MRGASASAAIFSKKALAIWPVIYDPHPKISQMVALLSAHRFVMIKSFLVAIRCLFTLDIILKYTFMNYNSNLQFSWRPIKQTKILRLVK